MFELSCDFGVIVGDDRGLEFFETLFFSLMFCPLFICSVFSPEKSLFLFGSLN
jgi:hypothetical protein